MDRFIKAIEQYIENEQDYTDYITEIQEKIITSLENGKNSHLFKLGRNSDIKLKYRSAVAQINKEIEHKGYRLYIYDVSDKYRGGIMYKIKVKYNSGLSRRESVYYIDSSDDSSDLTSFRSIENRKRRRR